MQRNKILSSLLILILIGFIIAKFYAKQHTNHQTEHAVSNDKPVNDAAIKNESSPYHSQKTNTIPEKVYVVLEHIKKYHNAPEGYEGGREFKNREHQLDQSTQEGKLIYYQEWDVNPKEQGHNRGRERLVTGDHGRAWYSGDHYQTFTEVK